MSYLKTISAWLHISAEEKRFFCSFFFGGVGGGGWVGAAIWACRISTEREFNAEHDG